MPLLEKMPPQEDFAPATGNSFFNPNSIARNTMRVTSGDTALIQYLSPIMLGDKSYYHGILGRSASGKQCSERHYCSTRSVDESGEGLLSTKCVYCVSDDEDERKTSPRYKYWVFVYAIYHAQQNPRFLDNKEGAPEYVMIKIGRKNLFVEHVMKPQLLEMSHTAWSSLDEQDGRMGDIAGLRFEWANRVVDGRNSYILSPDTKQLASAKDISTEEAKNMVKNLPHIGEVAAGIVEEFEFNTLSVDTEETEETGSDAMSNVLGTVPV